MSYFKFLARGGVGPMTGFVWQQGAWVETEGPLAVCARGAHVLRPEDLAHWMHEELWRVEIDGEWLSGGDCIVARRARVTERLDGWTGGDGVRFAESCLARLAARLTDSADPNEREHWTKYHWAVSRHVERKNAAMAGYVTALGIGQRAQGEAPIAAYRRERAWQSEWLVREMGLG